MKPPAIPEDDAFRLDALAALGLLDTPPEADFDAIVGLARELFEVPICLVTLVDRDRQWFKACIGLDVPETSREVSFCGHAILGDEAFVVLDAARDDRFSDNPLVIGPPGIRFYAGMPIRLPSGYRVGTVCVIDRAPRQVFDDRDARRLALLAEMAAAAMAVRGLRGALDESRRTADRLRLALTLAPSPLALTDAEGRVAATNPAFDRLCRAEPEDGATAADLLAVRPEDWSAAAADAEGEGEVRTGTDGRVIRVVQEPGGLILIARDDDASA